jgi:hypothetical protein
MKKFCIHLVAESPISLVEAKGTSALYEGVLEMKYEIDFVVRREDGSEVVRVNREHVLYVTTEEVVN